MLQVKDRERLIRVLAVVAVFLVASLVRWATLSSITGDDHYLLWVATGILRGGDRPFRDFVDLGAPLYWVMTTLAQSISGYRIIGEVGLGTLLVAFAFAVAFHLAWNATPLMLAYFLEGTGRTELPSWCVPVGGAVAVAGFLAARAGAAAADRRDSGTPPTAEAVHAR